MAKEPQKADDDKPAPPAPPAPSLPSPAASFFPPGTPTVTMVFPRKVTLTLNDHRRVQFGAGAQKVPAELKDHWYLKASGVKEA